MSWPRKNEGVRLYQERDHGSYLIVFTANGTNAAGDFDGVANVLPGSRPSLGSCGVDPAYLRDHCWRMAWTELPGEWRRAFRPWLGRVNRVTMRGLWRVAAPAR